MREYFWIAALLAICSPATAGVFIYENEAAVLRGDARPATEAPGGVVTTADQAIPSDGGPIVGFDDGRLFKTELIKFDKSLGAALVGASAAIDDKALLEAHRATIVRWAAFLPASSSSSFSSVSAAAGVRPIWRMTINGAPVGSDPVVLPVKSRTAKMDLELINASTMTVWSVDLRIESDTDARFMKRGRKKGLNDVPRRVLKYRFQALFNPIRENDVVSVPVDVFHVKTEEAAFTATIESTNGTAITTFPVRFE